MKGGVPGIYKGSYAINKTDGAGFGIRFLFRVSGSTLAQRKLEMGKLIATDGVSQVEERRGMMV
jgi:hypothetical protein